MINFPFIGGSYNGRSKLLDSQRAINFFLVTDKVGGKALIALMGTPGLVQFCDTGSSAEVRGLIVMGDYLYAISGSALYKVTTEGVATAQAGALTTTEGIVYMSHDGTNLMVVDPGIEGYTYTDAGGTLTAISDGDFPTPGTLTWNDGYFIVNESGTGKFYISSANDPTAWDATDYATAESMPDNLERVYAAFNRLWLIGSNTTEVWWDSGAADFPYERIAGMYIEHGTNSPDSVAHADNAVFWLNQYRQAIRHLGGNPEIISTEQIEYQWNAYSNVIDARGYCYTEEGHTFYVLTFPSQNHTWVYDAATGYWHERQSYPQLGSGEYGQHRGRCFARFNNYNLVGDYSNGKIYRYDLGTYTDDTYTIRRVRTAQAFHADRKPVYFDRLELQVEPGVGLNSGQGSDPQIMLDWSDDEGNTWSNELWRTPGAIGNYKHRAIWNRLGTSKERIFRASITDPVKTVIAGAYLKASSGVE